MSRWLDEGGHQCPELVEWLSDAIYDIIERKNRPKSGTKGGKRRRAQRVLVIVPNIETAHPIRDTVRFCPSCGARIKPVRIKREPRQSSGPPVVPDALPEDVG